MESLESIKSDLLQQLRKEDVDTVLKQYRQTQLPSQILIECFEDNPEHPFLLFTAAYHNTPSMLLTRMCDTCNDTDVLQRLAAHHRTPAEYLQKLAEHPQWPVRLATATNAAATPQTLELLVQDPVWIVREAVATNPALPTRLQTTLSKDIKIGRAHV